jgi:hypothetical protein
VDDDRETDDYDSPWKGLIEQYFPDFIAWFFPQAHAGIDWARGYEFLDQELAQVTRDAELGRRRVDKLARVMGREGREDWVWVHVEVQGARQSEFAERMFVYHYRLYDRYRKPVVSLAVLADAEAVWRPRGYRYRRWGCGLAFRFPVAKVLDWQDRWAELEQSRNPFAVVTQAHLKTQATRHAPAERYRWKWALLRGLYDRGFTREDVVALFHFLDWLMRLPAELEQQLWRELQAEEEVRKMQYVSSVQRIGRQEGLREGLDSERHLMLRWVRRRFGAAVAESSAPQLARIAAPAVLEDLGEALLDCADGAAWLALVAEKAGER